jgi:hypothetical protein
LYDDSLTKEFVVVEC